MDNHSKIKLVIIHPSALTQRWLLYYHLDELSKKIDVEWWNIAAIAAPHYDVQNVERPYVKTFISKNDFLRALRKLPNDTLIDFDRVMFCRNNYLLLNQMAQIRPNVIWFNFFAGDAITKAREGVFDIVEPHLDSNDQQSCHPIKKNFIKRCVTYTKKFLYRSHLLAYWIETLRDGKDAQLNHKKWFMMCWNLFDTIAISSSADSKYPIHSMDYEQYMQEGDPQPIKMKYIVYVDQNFPLHPETAREYPNLDIQALSREFYASMRKFFDTVEQETGYKVVIAMHPSSRYTNDTFGNRECILGKTAVLIRDCEGVIVNNSTALNFAVYWNKPIIFSHCKSYRQCFVEYELQKTLSRYFQIPSRDADLEGEIHFEKMPVEKRKEYMSYCTNERIEGKRNVDLYVEYLTQIHSEMFNKRK